VCCSKCQSGKDAEEVGQTPEDVPAVSVMHAMFLHTCEACCGLAQGVSASRRALPGTWLRGGEETRTRGASSRREVAL